MNMDSANLHQQQQQQQQQQVNKLVGSTSSSSSPLPTQSYSYGGAAAGSNVLAWSTPNNLILNNSLIPNLNGFISQRRNDDFAPDHQMPQNSLWASSSSKMKEGFSISSSDTHHNFPKFTEMLSDEHVDLSEKLLLKTISASGFHFNGHDHLYSNAGYGRPGSFSQIYPSINVSSLSQSDSDQSAFSSSSSLDMNLQALDLLTNARFSDQHSPSSFVASSGFDHQMQQSLNHSCSPSNKVQRAATDQAKRSSSLAEPSHTPKKSRLDSRPSCPPLKVRKEKLGDRIAALQQLVAPFGKTDTASVLMEAIGYIQFLQNQVKTLSVPYMKSSRNRSCRPMQGVPNEEGNEETRRDLRSRGLCLVPLSCMSYVANVDGGGCEGVWPPPPNFGATSTLR